MELQEADLVSDDQLSTPITPPVAGHLCVSVVVQIDPCAKVLFIFWWRRDKLKREGRYGVENSLFDIKKLGQIRKI